MSFRVDDSGQEKLSPAKYLILTPKRDVEKIFYPGKVRLWNAPGP